MSTATVVDHAIKSASAVDHAINPRKTAAAIAAKTKSEIVARIAGAIAATTKNADAPQALRHHRDRRVRRGLPRVAVRSQGYRFLQL